MTYQLPPELDARVQALMSTGAFETEYQLLSDAVSMVERRLADLESINRGLEDVEAGRVTPAREVSREMREKYDIPTQ